MNTTPSTTNSTSPAPLNAWSSPRRQFGGRSAIAHLFERLAGKFPAQWPRLFPTPEKVAAWEVEWAAEFLRLGITFAEVSRGLDNLTGKYPPNLGEFVAACRPAIDLEQTFHEAVEQMQRRRARIEFINQHPGQEPPGFTRDHWTSPVVYWAAVKLGQDLLTTPWVNMRGRWATAVADAQREMGLGALPNTIPEPVPALAAPGQQITPKETARERLATLASSFGLNPARAA